MKEKVVKNTRNSEPKLNSMVEITQIRSTIKRPKTQLLTIESLGLGKRNRTVKVKFTPQIKGMVQKVNHLVEIKEAKA